MLKDKLIYGFSNLLFTLLIIIFVQWLFNNKIDWISLVAYSVSFSLLLLMIPNFKVSKHNIFKKETLVLLPIYILSMVIIKFFVPDGFKIISIIFVIIICIAFEIFNRKKKQGTN